MNQRPTGFTLIEVMAVVVLVGLLAGATVMSLAGKAQHATRADAIDRLIRADADARLAAQRLGPAQLQFDLEARTTRLLTRNPETGGPMRGHPIRLPPGYVIDRVTWLDTRESAGSDPRPLRRVQVNSGVAALPISSAGLSRTYVISLAGPPGEAQRRLGEKQQTSWLIISGMTGQVVMEEDEQAVHNLFKALARTRPDTD